MATVLYGNVHNIAIEGTFDDGQCIVKALFSDLEFKTEYSLGAAINSLTGPVYWPRWSILCLEPGQWRRHRL